MTALWIAIAFLAVLSLAEAVAIVALARELGLLALRLPPAPALESGDGPAIGDPLPSVAITPLHSGEQRVLQGPSLRPTVLLFLSSGCASCRDLLAELRAVEMDWPDYEFLPIISGPRNAVAAMVRKCGYSGLVYRDGGEAMQQAGVGVTPTALVVGTDGLVTAQGVVNSREMVSSLLSGRVHVNHELVNTTVNADANATESGTP
jgi:thiol-disulfide isomerase/thioredoxin